MLGRFSRTFCALVLLAVSSGIAPAAEPVAPRGDKDQATASTPALVVLRNGEVFSGRVARQQDRYVIEGDGLEIRLPAREVDFLCQSLDEAYAVKRKRVMVASRIDDRLHLADWCLRHGLIGYAATELAAVMESDPRHPRLVWLDRRLRQAIDRAGDPLVHTANKTERVDSPHPIVETADAATSVRITSDATQPDAAQANAVHPVAAEPLVARPAALPPSPVELDTLARSLPAGTVEHFVETAQPLLLNHCSTVGCHGPGSKSQFTLVRPATGKVAPRGLSQRNLYNTLQWLDHKSPTDSTLLVKAKDPHGGKPVGVLAEPSAQYRQLVAWVTLAVGGKTSSVAVPPASVETMPPSIAPLQAPPAQTPSVKTPTPFRTSPVAPHAKPQDNSESGPPAASANPQRMPLSLEDAPFNPGAFNQPYAPSSATPTEDAPVKPALVD